MTYRAVIGADFTKGLKSKGSLYDVTRFSILKQHLSLDKTHQIRDIKRSYDTENHCGYLIGLDLANSAIVKSRPS